MRQLKVGLPDGVRAELERAAKSRGITVSQEARLRLETSLSLDYFDAAALELAEHILQLADDVSRFENTGARPVKDWHKNPVLFEALKIAVETWLKLIAPDASEKSASTLDPQTLGRSVAVSQYRRLREKIKVDREMNDLRESMRDKPMFFYSGAYGTGSVTLREMDEAKLSDRDRDQLADEVERQLEHDRRRDGLPRRKPSEGD
jgi:hypothetical protein